MGGGGDEPPFSIFPFSFSGVAKLFTEVLGFQESIFC